MGLTTNLTYIISRRSMKARDAIASDARLLIQGAMSAALIACGNVQHDTVDDRVRSDTQLLAWSEQDVLKAPSAEESDLFGTSVALDGNIAVVGVPGDAGDDETAPLPASGSAQLFVRTEGKWASPRRLRAPEPEAAAQFGFAVAVAPGLAVVGAPFANGMAGHVYAYRADAGDWSAPGTVLEDPAPNANRQFGYALAASGDTVMVGAPGNDVGPGAAYAFVWNGSEWCSEALLPDEEASVRDGDYFGSAVATEGTVAVVSATNVNGDRGAAYVFERSEGDCGTSTPRWAQTQKLVGMDTLPGDRFGDAVAVRAGILVVTSTQGLAGFGAAYPFRLGPSGWTQGPTLSSPSPDVGTAFGQSVAIGPETILIGAPSHNYFGAAFPYVEQDNTWIAGDLELPSETVYTSGFGASVAISGTTAVIGAPYAEFTRGVAYVLAASQGSACSEGAECASGYCVEGVCCNELCTDLCRSCLAKHQNQEDGICAPVAESTNPRKAACDSQVDKPCRHTGLCDGKGDCALAAKGTECVRAGCFDASTALPAAYCDGVGYCSPAQPKGCAGYACVDHGCQTPCKDDNDCDVDYLCDDSQQCAAKTGLGLSCGTDRQCRSGHCADGVCCSKACTGQCESCSENDSEGTCVAVRGKPRGARDACPDAPDDEPCAAVECDGESRDSCERKADADIVCRQASCVEGIPRSEGRCDGSGQCAGAEVGTCGAYACDGASCFFSCTSDAQCAPESQCRAGECQPGPRCNDAGTAVIDTDGIVTDCAPYKCRFGGCLQQCSESYDCADPTVAPCSMGTGRCARIEQRMTTSRGCGCRVGQVEHRPQVHWFSAVLLSLIFRRRQRVTRRPAARTWEN